MTVHEVRIEEELDIHTSPNYGVYGFNIRPDIFINNPYPIVLVLSNTYMPYSINRLCLVNEEVRLRLKKGCEV